MRRPHATDVRVPLRPPRVIVEPFFDAQQVEHWHDGLMTRYAVDAVVALRLVRAQQGAHEPHQLVGPSVLRSHALSMLYRDVRDGRLDEKTGRDQLEGLAGLKIRLLADRVSRSTAWKLADQLGWDDTTAAEYLAVAVLQADALVTEDDQLIAGARGLVPLASYADLLR